MPRIIQDVFFAPKKSTTQRLIRCDRIWQRLCLLVNSPVLWNLWAFPPMMSGQVFTGRVFRQAFLGSKRCHTFIRYPSSSPWSALSFPNSISSHFPQFVCFTLFFGDHPCANRPANSSEFRTLFMLLDSERKGLIDLDEHLGVKWCDRAHRPGKVNGARSTNLT